MKGRNISKFPLPMTHSHGTSPVYLLYIHIYPIKINYLENKLLLISINFTPKTRHSCLKKWYEFLCFPGIHVYYGKYTIDGWYGPMSSTQKELGYGLKKNAPPSDDS